MSKTDITGPIAYLVHGTSEFVDDADVGRPSDSERNVEVDYAGSKNVGGVRL